MRLAPCLPLTLAISIIPAIVACSDDTTPAPGAGGTSTTGGTAGAAGTPAAGAAGTPAAGAGGTPAAGAGGTPGAGAGGTPAAGAGGTPAAGAGGSGTAGGGAADFPADSSQAGIEAYLATQPYMGTGWRPETMPSDGTSVHGATRRYFNETLIASHAVNPSPTGANPRATGSMVVKEILEAGAVAGHAVLLRTEGMWVYYCKASIDGRCYTGSTANTASYGTTSGSCACHGSGTITSVAVIPAP